MIFSMAAMLIAVGLALHIVAGRPRDFVLFLMPIGILEFGADLDGAAGLANVSAIWLLLLLIVSGIAVCRIGSGGCRLNVPEILYLLFLGWCVVESARANDRSYAARALLRLLFPFMTMYLARRTIGDAGRAERLIKTQYLATCGGASVAWGMIFLPAVFSYLTQVVWFGAAFFDQCAVIVFLPLAVWKVRGARKSLLLAAVLVALCFVAVNRTTLIAVVAGASIFCLLEFRKLAIVLLPMLYLSLGAVVMLVPSFREKMFYQPDKVHAGVLLTTDVLSNKQFNNDGRYAMWTEILNRFFWPNPAMGSGLGSTQEWFYTGAAREVLHTPIRVEHSEYVKLAADTGAIGLGIYAAMHLSAFGLALGSYRKAKSQPARIFAIAAACSLPVFWVCMAFDNALLYVLPVAQFPTAFAAIASSLASSQPADVPIKVEDEAVAARWLPRRRPGRRFAQAQLSS